jgi:hypothetical protein
MTMATRAWHLTHLSCGHADCFRLTARMVAAIAKGWLWAYCPVCERPKAVQRAEAQVAVATVRPRLAMAMEA